MQASYSTQYIGDDHNLLWESLSQAIVFKHCSPVISLWELFQKRFRLAKVLTFSSPMSIILLPLIILHLGKVCQEVNPGILGGKHQKPLVKFAT